MSLNLDLDGIMMNIDILNYQYYDKSNWDDLWCITHISFKSDLIDYSTDNCCLLASEVDSICVYIADLLSGKMEEDTCFSCVEPDLKFKFVPLVRSKIFYTKLTVNLWVDGYMTDNYLSLYINEDNCKKLLNYLEEVRLPQNSINN